MRVFIALLCLVFSLPLLCNDSSVLSLMEYLAYVKRYHPIVKQAHLIIDESEAKLMKARGNFDPKIQANLDRKHYDEKLYFENLGGYFKIPTWYGIEIKGAYERNLGDFLNPESTIPQDGLYGVGISIPLAKNLLMNDRMATLKQAKIFKNQAIADNKLQVNDILYDASITYFHWLKAYKEKRVYTEFLQNAQFRFQGVKRSFQEGDKPAIDTTESRIQLQNRILSLEKANLNYIKASLELSNYLWINNVPVEVTENIIPDLETISEIDQTINTNGLPFDINSHPKLQSLGYKIDKLNIERKLKSNNLLPEINLNYNLLMNNRDIQNNINYSNYKAYLNLNIPIFLRKERADLNLAKYKIQATDYEKQIVELTLQNKLKTISQSLLNYKRRININKSIVSDYNTLFKGEQRKFQIGESSLFMLNSRESMLIESRLKGIELENSFLNTKGELFKLIVAWY